MAEAPSTSRRGSEKDGDVIYQSKDRYPKDKEKSGEYKNIIGKVRRYNATKSMTSTSNSPSSKHFQPPSPPREDNLPPTAREWNYDGIKFRGRKIGLPAVSGASQKKIKGERSMGDDSAEPSSRDHYASMAQKFFMANVKTQTPKRTTDKAPQNPLINISMSNQTSSRISRDKQHFPTPKVIAER